MAEFDSILQCTLGSSGFQLDDYERRVEPELRDGALVGRRITITGEGYVTGSSASDFATKLAAAADGFTVSGADFTVKGLGGHVECQVLAAKCLDGGPHVAFTVLKQKDQTALLKRFQFVLAASQSASSYDAMPDPVAAARDSRRVKTHTGPDGVRRIALEGAMSGPNLGAEIPRLLADARAAYPWPGWAIDYDVDANERGDSLRFTVTIRELTAPLPGNAQATAVDGEARWRRERDSQGRLVATYAYDFLVQGDPIALYTMLRPTQGRITHEGWEVTVHQGVRLLASFSVLDSADLNGLLNWDCTVEASEEAAVGRIDQYDGVRAVAVLDAAPVYRVAITGRAVGLGAFPRPPQVPDLVGEGFVPDGPPVVRRKWITEHEAETTWTYSFAGVRAIGAAALAGLAAAAARPDQPEFYA